jgi:2-polyprenyl-6-methoxyphenol hydroxylase-like FAD-dependent oxidoreductase
MSKSVLVSGASIAGPAVAHWLHRYGFAVTVVEKAGALRGGGYPIDLRGTAVEVADRMGIGPQVRAAHIDTRRVSFVDDAGDTIAALRPEVLSGGVEGRDLELPRGDLATALYGLIEDGVRFRFGDSVETLHDDGAGVDVTFASGDRERFDLVIGADGLHSKTRSLVFGPEEQYHRYLGSCFAGFTLPNCWGLAHEGVIWNAVGRGAVVYAPGEGKQLHGFLTFRRDEPPFAAFHDPAAQRDLVAATFPEQAWLVPDLVAAMRSADDLFFDVVSQIHLPRWSRGRVALVGDAAYAPSFRSGQGSSIALVGAYVLAGELARTDDHAAAFAAYESICRDFVAQNQALATSGGSAMGPATAEDLAALNATLRTVAAQPEQAPPPSRVAATTAIDLPDYPAPRPVRG